MNIGAVKKIRTQKGVLQKDIAFKAGVSVRALQNYESGKRKPSIDIVIRLAKALGVEVTDLFPMQEVESQ